MERLIAGYHRFRTQGWPGRRVLFERLAEGQAPRALVLACADSRVDPAMIFDAAPGEIFVVRNVAIWCRPASATRPITAPVRRSSSACARWRCATSS